MPDSRSTGTSIQINIMWGLINLLPIWPLDGGQITETVLSQVNPYQRPPMDTHHLAASRRG